MQSLVAHGSPPQQRSPLSPDEVYSALTASLSADGTTRTQAQALLQEWEADSSPGFIGSLLKIVHEVNSVPEVRHAGCGHAHAWGQGTPPLDILAGPCTIPYLACTNRRPA